MASFTLAEAKRRIDTLSVEELRIFALGALISTERAFAVLNRPIVCSVATLVKFDLGDAEWNEFQDLVEFVETGKPLVDKPVLQWEETDVGEWSAMSAAACGEDHYHWRVTAAAVVDFSELKYLVNKSDGELVTTNQKFDTFEAACQWCEDRERELLNEADEGDDA